MRVALVYDRINKWGGAERVLLSLRKIYPDAPVYTLVHEPATSTWSEGFDVRSSWLNKIPYFRSRHELLAPIAAMGFETFNFDEFDVVITVTSADAKAIITKPQTLHICYCLTPTRYYWGGISDYQTDMKLKLLPSFIYRHLQSADLAYSSRPDSYLVISDEVKKRVVNYYHQNADIIYPPVDNKFYSNNHSRSAANENYYLLVSRLVSYKKVDIAISAFNKMKKKLYIAGIGEKEGELKKQAASNIKFLGSVSDDELTKLYTNAKALIFPQNEDFGLVPLESQACGTPVIAYERGGALETVIQGKTGLFFREQTADSIIQAVGDFESGKHKISALKCIANAKTFSEDRFINKFSAKVDSLWCQYQKTLM